MIRPILTFAAAACFLSLVSHRAIGDVFGEIVAFALIGGIGLVTVLMAVAKPQRIRVPKLSIRISFLLFLFVAVCSGPLACLYYVNEAINLINFDSLALLLFSILCGAGIFWLLCSPRIDENDFIIILLVLPLTIAFIKGGLLLSGAIEGSSINYFTRWGGKQVILVGWFSEPSIFAGHLGVCLGIALFNPNLSIRPAFLFFAALGLLLTASMTAVGFIILIILISIFSLSKRKAFFLIGIFIAFCALIFMSKYDFISSRLINSLTLRDNSVNARLFVSWQGALEIIRDSWGLVGVGIGNYKSFVGSLYPGIPGGGRSWNVFAIVMAAVGLFGFLPFLVMHLKLMYNNWRIGVLLVAYGFTTGAAYTPLYWLYFFLCLYFSEAKIKRKMINFGPERKPAVLQALQLVYLGNLNRKTAYD